MHWKMISISILLVGLFFVIIQQLFVQTQTISLIPEPATYEEVEQIRLDEQQKQVEEKQKEIQAAEKEGMIHQAGGGMALTTTVIVVPEGEFVATEAEEKEEVILETINLAIPFTPQAPHANWEMPYQEACEEASVYMVHLFYEGLITGLVEAAVADQELLAMVAFQEEQGLTPDVTAEELVGFIKDYYQYEQVEVLEEPTIEDLKQHLTYGRPVIIPAAGRMLGNPNFSGEGPLYHMLVLRGYTDTQFITNDPGTKNGEAYLYNYETIMNAMHDWNGGDVENGRQVAVVIYPN